MKHRVALLLITSIILSSCGTITAQETTIPSQQQSASTPTDEEIEKRIKEVGESYDGLYKPTYDNHSYGAINSLAPQFNLKSSDAMVDESYATQLTKHTRRSHK